MDCFEKYTCTGSIGSGIRKGPKKHDCFWPLTLSCWTVGYVLIRKLSWYLWKRQQPHLRFFFVLVAPIVDYGSVVVFWVLTKTLAGIPMDRVELVIICEQSLCIKSSNVKIVFGVYPPMTLFLLDRAEWWPFLSFNIEPQLKAYPYNGLEPKIFISDPPGIRGPFPSLFFHWIGL